MQPNPHYSVLVGGVSSVCKLGNRRGKKEEKINDVI
jgi:hypothetical protein